ncbi:MFS transporter [Nocardioides sp. NPDC101246]|uniref:MFS transporter n=1 Tax=Nocardioides sp. NPDC101246 TaxID=3364336 RepID=UPI00382635E0
MSVHPPPTRATDDLPLVSTRFIWTYLVASFGAFLAFVTPIAISLAIRVKQIAPDNEEQLGYVIGTAAAVTVFAGPVIGMLSDRTRSRLGRRRPWILGGAILGLLGLLVLAVAPTVLLLGVGWVIAALGWNTVLNIMVTVAADRLPESQRGKVSGIAGFITMVAPVAGAVVGGALTGSPLLMFLVPGVLGGALVMVFVLLFRDEDSRDLPISEPLTLSRILANFVFDPRRHPDFAWNWLGRLLFYFGLTLNTTFTAYFLAARSGRGVEEVSTIVAVNGGLSVVAVMIGALSSGVISDRIGRRKPFVLLAGALFSSGALIMAFAPGLPVILAGSFVATLGLGLFSAVDQALLLDVMPERETDAGRFVAINQFATSISQAVAPVLAPLVLTFGVVAGGEKNYTLLYMVAAVFTLLAGAAVMRVKSVR